MNKKPTFDLKERIRTALSQSAPVPKMQEGGTEGEKLARIINPKNWFVKDYTKSGDFNTAFYDAKSAGEEEFIWNNKRYSTKSNLSKEAQMKSYGITDEQRKLTPSGSTRFVTEPIKKASENISNIETVWGYEMPLKNLASAAIGRNIVMDFPNGPGLNWEKNEVHSEYSEPLLMFKNYLDSPNDLGAKEQDALRLYLGLPQRYKSFKPSRYKKGAFEITGYNKYLPKEMPPDDYIKEFGHWSFDDGTLKPFGDMVMGKHTVKKGKDERGEYIEYMDKFDFDTYGLIGEFADKLNKPFEIYGRKYYKDYGGGVKKQMQYTDKELMSLDPKKKNFDTLALQEELYNRGYDLKGSITKEGELDGILGEDTISALLDWQSKNKSNISKKEQGGMAKFDLKERINRVIQEGGNVSAAQQALGYKDNSPYKNMPYQDIYSDRITMSGVSRPLVATTDTGVRTVMQPGGEYYFPGATQVRETPLYSNGGGTKDRENLQTMKLNTYTTPLSKLTGISTPKFQNSGGTSPGAGFWNLSGTDKIELFTDKSGVTKPMENRNKISLGKTPDGISINRVDDILYLEKDGKYVPIPQERIDADSFRSNYEVLSDIARFASQDITDNGIAKAVSDLYDKYVKVNYIPERVFFEKIEGSSGDKYPNFFDIKDQYTTDFLREKEKNKPVLTEEQESAELKKSALNNLRAFASDLGIIENINDNFTRESLNNLLKKIEESKVFRSITVPQDIIDLLEYNDLDSIMRDVNATPYKKIWNAHTTIDEEKVIEDLTEQEYIKQLDNYVSKYGIDSLTKKDKDYYNSIQKTEKKEIPVMQNISSRDISIESKNARKITPTLSRSLSEVPALQDRAIPSITPQNRGQIPQPKIIPTQSVQTSVSDIISADNTNAAPVYTNTGGANPPVVNPPVVNPTAADQKDGGDYINMQSKDKDWDYRYNTQTNQWEVKRKKENTWIKIDDATKAKRKAKPAIEAAYGQDLQAELDKRKKAAADKKAAEDAAKAGGTGTGTDTGGAETEGPTTDVTKTDGTTTTTGGGQGKYFSPDRFYTSPEQPKNAWWNRPTTETSWSRLFEQQPKNQQATQVQTKGVNTTPTTKTGVVNTKVQPTSTNPPSVETDMEGMEKTPMQRNIDKFLEERATAEKSKANIQEIQRKRQELEQLGLPPEFTNTDNTVVPNNTVQKEAEQPVRDYYGPPYVNGGQIPQYSTGGKTLSGAVSGASAGSVLGPIGIGVGAIVGGLAGFLTGRSQEKAAREQRNAELAAQSSNMRQSGLSSLINLLGSNNQFTNLLTGPDLQNMPQRSPAPYNSQLFPLTPKMSQLLPPPFQEGAQVEAPIYANETPPQVYSTGLNREQLQTPGVKPTLLDMKPLKKEKDTESSQSAAETQAGTGQRVITIKDEDGTPKRVLIDSAGNVIRFIDQPMSEQEKLNRDYQEAEDYIISARNFVEQERQRRAQANQNPVRQQQGGPIITSLLYRNMDKNNSIKNNISMNKSKLESVINLSNKVNPYRLSPMGVYKNGGLIMEGGVSASRAGFSRQPITGASSTGPLGPKRSEVPSYTNKGVNSIMDLPTNEYVPTENMIPIQAEIGEMIVLPTGDLMPVMARRRHHQMQDDEVTDMTPENSYILSAHGQVRINRDEANFLITETGVKPYRLGQSQNPPTEKTLASVMTKKVMRPAEVAKRINSLFPVLSTDNPFEIAANIENKINRKPYLEGLIQLSELDKYRKGLSEPAMSDLEQQQMQMPQRMPGSPMLARQGRRISRPGVVKAQDSLDLGNFAQNNPYIWRPTVDQQALFPPFPNQYPDSTVQNAYTLAELQQLAGSSVVAPRTDPYQVTPAQGDPYGMATSTRTAPPQQNQNGIFSALSAPANFAARLIGSQAIRNAERAGIRRERGIYDQGFGRMGNLMTAGTAAEAAMLGAQDPFVKWRDIPDTYIRSMRTQTPGQVVEAQSAAAFANLPDYSEMGQAGLAAQNAAYARGLEQSSRAMMDAAERDRAAFNTQQALLQENLAGNVAGRLAAERATTAAINKMLSGYGSLANRYAQGQIDLTGQRMGANIGLSRAEQASKTGLYQNRLNAFTTFTGDMAAGGEAALKALLGFGG